MRVRKEGAWRCCGLLPLSVESIAGASVIISIMKQVFDTAHSELAEPQKLLNYLLQPRVLTLPPEIVAVYLQGALKVFGSWATELAEQWDDEDLARVKNAVSTVLERIGDFASSPDIEVQERVCFLNITQHEFRIRY